MLTLKLVLNNNYKRLEMQGKIPEDIKKKLSKLNHIIHFILHLFI